MPTKPRIQLIDFLRGIAISGILLIHHIEHFNFYLKPSYKTKWLVYTDKWVWNNLFDIVSGKAFALFSLLFGVSFWIINENRKERGQPYFYVHFWRMFLLALIGGVHLLFFNGDILIMYAFVGFLLIFAKYLSQKALLFIAILLLINPIYLYNIFANFTALELYDFRLTYPKANHKNILSQGNFFEVLKMNYSSGILFTLIWSWNVGRFFSILGLFFLGAAFRKAKLFTSTPLKTWFRITILSIFLIGFFSWMDFVWPKLITDKVTLKLMKIMIKNYLRLSQMFLFLSAIVIFWKYNQGKIKFTKIVNFGRMGLTNYVLMSVIGSFLYYGWGLGLYQYCGSLTSFIIGLICLWFQIQFSSWWLKSHKQGPLEKLWRELTWKTNP